MNEKKLSFIYTMDYLEKLINAAYTRKAETSLNIYLSSVGNARGRGFVKFSHEKSTPYTMKLFNLFLHV